MKRLSWMLMLCCLAPLVQAQSLDKQALLEQIRETRSAEQAAMREREQTFLRERNQQSFVCGENAGALCVAHVFAVPAL